MRMLIEPIVCVFPVLAILQAIASGVELDDVKPEERRAVASLRKNQVDVVLDAHGRVTELRGGQLADEQMALVGSLMQLTQVDLTHARISDDGLVHVGNLRKLRRLQLPENLSRASASMNRDLSAGLRAIGFLKRAKGSTEKNRISDKGIAHLAELGNLEYLGIATTSATDDSLKGLSNLTRLRELDLASTDVTDAGTLHLQHLESLAVLDLDNTRVGDMGLKRLSRLPRLKKLSLHSTLVSRQAVDELRSEMPDLDVIPELLPARDQVKAIRAVTSWGGDVELDEQGRAIRVSLDKPAILLSTFAELQRLKKRPQPEKAVAALTRDLCVSLRQALPVLPTVEDVDLSGLSVQDEDLVMFRRLRNLRKLDLSETAITDDGLDELTPLKQLTRLNFSGTAITDGGLARLEPLNQLERLDLRDTETSLSGVLPLLAGSQGRSFKEALAIVGIAKRTDDGTIELPTPFRPRLTDSTIQYLKPWTSFEELDLSESEITDAALAYVAKMTNLQTLDLSGQPISDKGLGQLSGLGLRHLTLDGTAVTDAAMEQLAAMRHLEAVSLRYARISHQAAAKLRESRRDLVLSPDGLPAAEIIDQVAQINRKRRLGLPVADEMQSRDSIIRAYLGDRKEDSRLHRESIYKLLEGDVLLLDDGQDETEIKSLIAELMHKAFHNVDLLIERLEAASYMFAIPEYLRIPAPEDAAAQVDAFEAKCGRFVPMTYRAWFETIGCVCLMGTHPGWPEITYNGLGGRVGAVCSDPLVAFWTPEFGLTDAGSCERIEFAPDPGHKANYSSSGSYNLPTTAAPSIDAIVTDDDNSKYWRTFLDHLRDSFDAGGFPGWQHYDNAPTASLDALRCDFQLL